MNVIPGRLALAVAAIIVVIVVTSRGIDAQDSSSIEAFEAASIKPKTGERAGPAPTSPDRFIRPDATLGELIRYAYNLQEFQIEGGPSWLTSSRFDVNAKAAAVPTSIDGMRSHVRRLLQDRFALKAHLESRERSLYEMVVARGDRRLGERLRPSTLDCEALLSAGTATPDDRRVSPGRSISSSSSRRRASGHGGFCRDPRHHRPMDLRCSPRFRNSSG